MFNANLKKNFNQDYPCNWFKLAGLMFLRNWPKVKENRQMNKPLCVFTKDISSILNSLMKTNSTQPSLNKQQHSIQCEIKTFMTTNLQINKANGKILVSPPETHMLHCGLFFRMMCRVYFLMRYVSSILITLRGEQWRKSNKNCIYILTVKGKKLFPFFVAVFSKRRGKHVLSVSIEL